MSSPGKGTEESKPISSEPTDELNTPNPNITESAYESKKSDPNITGTTIESQKSGPNFTVSTDESKKPDPNITDSTCEPKAPTPAIKESEEPNKKSPVPMEKYKVPSTSLILSPSQRRPREPQMAMSPRKEDNEFEMPEEERQMIASFLRGCSLRMNEYISSFQDVATDLNFLTLGYRYMSRVLSCFDQDADSESDPSRCNEMRTHKVETSPLRALPAPQSTFRQSAIPRVSKVAVNLNLAFQSVSSVKSEGISESKRQTQGENLEIVEHETQTANEENVLSRRIFEERRKQKSLEEQFSLLSITEKDDTRDLRIGALSRRILEERRMQKSLEEQFPLLSLAEDDDTTDLQMGSLDSHIHASGARKFEVTEMGFKRRRSVSEEGGNRAKVPLIGTVAESTRQGEDQSASTNTETTIAETSGNPEIAEDEFSSLGALAYSLTSQSRIPTETSTNVNAEITDALGISTTEISETLEYVSDYLKELGDLGSLIFDDTSTTIPGVDEYQNLPNVSTFSSETSQPVISSYSSEEPPLTIPQAINILDFEKSGTMSESENIKINISPNSEASTSVKTLVSDEYLSPGYIPSTAKTEAFKANIPLTSESSTASTFLSDEYLFAGYSPSTAKTEAFKANIPLTSESSTSSTLVSGEYLSAGYIPSTAKTEAFKANIPLTSESSTSSTFLSDEYLFAGYSPSTAKTEAFKANIPLTSESSTASTFLSDEYLFAGYSPSTAKTEAFKANIPLTSESSTSSTFLSDEYLFADYSPSTAKTEAFKANIPLTSESSTSSTLASGEYLSAGYIPSTAKTEAFKANIPLTSESSTSSTLVSGEYLSAGYIPSTAKTEALKANIPLTSESSTSSTFLSDEYLFAGYSPSTAKTEAFKANIPLTSESSTSSTLVSGEYLSADYIPSIAKTEAFKTNIPLTLESSTSVDTLASGEYYIPTLQQFEGNLPTASEETTLVDTSVSNKYLTTGLNPTTLTSITYRVPELPEITNQSSKFNVKTHSMGLTAPIVRDQSRPDISLPEKLPAGAPISTIFRVPEMPQITIQPSIPGFKSNFKVLRTPPNVGRARRDQDIPETSSTTSPTERPELGASGWSSLPTTPDSHYAKTPSLNVTIPIVRSYKSTPEKPFSRSLPTDLRTIYSRQSLERSLLPTNPSIVRSQERVDPTIIKPQTRLAGRDKGVPHTHIPSSLREDKKTSEAPSSSKMSAKLYKFLSETPASDIARMTSYFGVQQNIAETYDPSSSKPGTELSPYRNPQRFTSHLPPFSTEFLSPPIRDFANKLASSTSGGGIENPVPGPSGLRSGGSVDKTESKSDPHSEWIKNTMLYKLLQLPPFEELGVTQYYKQFSATIPEEKEVSAEEKKRLEEEEKKEEEKKKWIEEEKKKITLTELLK